MINQLNWSLEILNQSNFYLGVYNFTSLNWNWTSLEARNYTNEIVNSSYYNVNQFKIRIYFFNQSANTTYSIYLNLTNIYTEFWNFTVYSPNPYRLISPVNRQNPNELIFNEEIQTIAILDYFDNVLYREDLNYTEDDSFVDIGLPICEITIENNHNFSIYVDIFRGLGTSIQLLIPGGTSITLDIYITSYYVQARNLNLELINVTTISPNRSKTMILTFGEKKAIEIPKIDFWNELLSFFFGSWLGILLFSIIVLLLVISLVDLYLRIRDRRKKKRSSKRRKVQRIYDNLGKGAET